jgi:hypothetical protein
MPDEINADIAKTLAATGWWLSRTDEEIVRFQLFTDLLCMPWGRFQEAVGKVLKRPVWTHEFARPELLRKEFLGDRAAPTMQEILDMIPEAKRLVVVVE